MRAAAPLTAIGWGANQFAPMILVYRSQDALSATTDTGLFAVYAGALIPALLVAGPYSDRHGRRRVIRAMAIASAVASALMVIGAQLTPALFAGRLLAGVASGAAFAAGSAWVNELSADAPAGTGARRTAVALSAGFGGGPVVAGVLAQWLPAPLAVPYLAHMAVMTFCGILAWRTPETVHGAQAASGRPTIVPPIARQRHFLAVALWAPLVFVTATVGFVVLPGLVAERVADIDVAFAGLLAAVTLGSGIAVQPLARRAGTRSDFVPAALLLAAGGLTLAGAVATVRWPLLAAVAAAALGASYGSLLTAGLIAVTELARAEHLAQSVACFYSCTYLGMSTPFCLSVLAGRGLSTSGWLIVLAGGPAVLASSHALTDRRPRRRRPNAGQRE